MKNRFLYLLFLVAFAASCVKQGPTGPVGTAGINGTQGIAGTNGVDGANGKDGYIGKDGINGTAFCFECHKSDSKIIGKQIEYNTSVHANGTTYYGENHDQCAGCHNNEGFNQRILQGGNFTLTGAMPVTGFASPTPISCYTCHSIHTKYDSTDYRFKSVVPVVCMADSSITFDRGNSNLCINCHQSRSLAVVDSSNKGITNLKNAADNDLIVITSNRFGPHHGPQGNMLSGASTSGKNQSGAFQVGTATAYGNGSISHANYADNKTGEKLVTCIKCHMASPISGAGPNGGGHSFNVSYYASSSATTKTLNINGCLACHTATEAQSKFTNTQSIVLNKLSTLQGYLGNKGWIDTTKTSSTYQLIKATTAKPLVVSAIQAKVLYNYRFILEDRSLGVHNSEYTNELLDNAIALALTW
jgi:hypothetical protein